jgi:hypothetical protein
MAEKVNGWMNCWALAVRTTRTRAPRWTSPLAIDAALYAAMPPLTPSTIVFPSSTLINHQLHQS